MVSRHGLLCDCELANTDDNWLTCCTWSAGMVPPGGCPPPIFFLELTNWSKNELVSWSKFINLYHFLPFFPNLTVKNDKKNYWITFYYQIGYKLSITEQKVTNSSFYLNQNVPTVGQNAQQLDETILEAHPREHQTFPVLSCKLL